MDVSPAISLWGYKPDFERSICCLGNTQRLLLLLFLLQPISLLCMFLLLQCEKRHREAKSFILKPTFLFFCLCSLFIPGLPWHLSGVGRVGGSREASVLCAGDVLLTMASYPGWIKDKGYCSPSSMRHRFTHPCSHAWHLTVMLPCLSTGGQCSWH